MKITAQVLNDASMKREIQRFEKLVGRGVGDGVKQIAESTGRALASKIRPYGMSAKKGQEFEDNIFEQIRHVAYGVNVGAYSGDSMKAAHEAQRKRGRVRIREISGDKWLAKIRQGEMHAYAKRKQANAGMVKAGWIEATQKATKDVMKRIPLWIRRHVGRGVGSGRMYKVGAKTYLDLQNKVPYASDAQSDWEVESSLENGRKNALKFMMLQINKSTRSFK